MTPAIGVSKDKWTGTTVGEQPVDSDAKSNNRLHSVHQVGRFRYGPRVLTISLGYTF